MGRHLKGSYPEAHRSIVLAAGGKDIPLVYVSDRSAIYIFSQNPDSAWLSGIIKNGFAQIRNGNAQTYYDAMVVTGEETENGLREMFAAKFGRESAKKWFSNQPVFVRLTPSKHSSGQEVTYGEWLKQSFDLVSRVYDRGVHGNPFGTYLRERTVSYMKTAFPPGSLLLEIGCGSGIETMKMLESGYRIHAVDVSPEMIAILRGKAQQSGLSMELSSEVLRASSMGKLSSGQKRYDGAFSNFGALNCEEDLEPVFEALQTLVKPGGRLVFGLYNPISLVDKLCSLMEADMAGMFARLKSPAPHEDSSLPVDAWFHSPWTVNRIARKYGFRELAYEGLGASFPTLGHTGIVSRLARHTGFLMTLDRLVGGIWPVKAISDVQVLILERNS